MTSLPMPPLPSGAAIPFPAGLEATRGQGEQFLLQAFREFSEAADALQRSYGMLRAEVARLNSELEQSNAGLKRSLAENREMRDHLDRILDGLPCGVLVVRSDGAISLMNPEARRLLGSARTLSDVESNSESLSMTQPEMTPPELCDLLRRARSTADEQEQLVADGRGGQRWLAVRHAAVRDRDDIKTKDDTKNENDENRESADCVSLFILRDVSDAKRLLREKDKLRREQALAEMSAILAHEIRNPLGSLELFAGLLAGAGLPAECREWVEQVQAGLRTLAATVNNVLHFYSQPAPERTPVDLGLLLDWAGAFLLPMARQARVELCLRNRLHGTWFSADRHCLEQVLLNLVLNAFRAMPGGGWIEISGQRLLEGDYTRAAISVSDTGPGLRNGELDRIFDPGFSTHAGSPGLGLTVCRKIVEQHEGSLAAGNRPGAGASFLVTFPLAAQPPAEGPTQNAPQQERISG